jgi:hypothetical protein
MRTTDSRLAGDYRQKIGDTHVVNIPSSRFSRNGGYVYYEILIPWFLDRLVLSPGLLLLTGGILAAQDLLDATVSSPDDGATFSECQEPFPLSMGRAL